jgi:hypothetical protein
MAAQTGQGVDGPSIHLGFELAATNMLNAKRGQRLQGIG